MYQKNLQRFLNFQRQTLSQLSFHKESEPQTLPQQQPSPAPTQQPSHPEVIDSTVKQWRQTIATTIKPTAQFLTSAEPTLTPVSRAR